MSEQEHSDQQQSPDEELVDVVERPVEPEDLTSADISEDLKVHVDADAMHAWDKVRDDYAVDPEMEIHRPAIAAPGEGSSQEAVEAAEQAEDPDVHGLDGVSETVNELSHRPQAADDSESAGSAASEDSADSAD